MKVYFDENFPTKIARGLRDIQSPLDRDGIIEILSISEEFGRGTPDEEWIPKVGSLEGCVITQDYNIKTSKHQFELCKKYGLGMFYLRPAKKKGMNYWEMVILLIKYWKDIRKIVQFEKTPFNYTISPRGIKRS